MANLSLDQQILRLRLALMWAGVFERSNKASTLIAKSYFRALDEAAHALSGAKDKKRAVAVINKLLAFFKKDAPTRIVQEVEALQASICNAVLGESEAALSWDGMVEGFNSVDLSPAQIIALATSDQVIAGVTMQDWFAGLGAHYDEAINAAKTAILRGINPVKAARELSRGFAGASKRMAHDVETIILSYVNKVANASAGKVYDANKDIIRRYEWEAVLEIGDVSTGRGTCPRCMALDGQRFKAEQDAPPRPLHPRCRCMLVPVTKTWRELGFDVDEMADLYRPWYDRDKSRQILDKGKVGGSFAELWLSKPETWQRRAIGRARTEWVNEAKGYNGKLSRFEQLVATVESGRYKAGDLILLKDLTGYGD